MTTKRHKQFSNFILWFNGVATIIWFALIFISISTGLKESLVWIVLMSAWANFASHFAAWISAIIERNGNS